MSYPEEKARPEPVTTSARTPSSASTSSSARPISRSISSFRAFILSARSRVSIAIPRSCPSET
jgi:hypothetical protein